MKRNRNRYRYTQEFKQQIVQEAEEVRNTLRLNSVQ